MRPKLLPGGAQASQKQDWFLGNIYPYAQFLSSYCLYRIQLLTAPFFVNAHANPPFVYRFASSGAINYFHNSIQPPKNRHQFLDNRINKPILSAISFIAPSLAATAFGAIILRSSLTRLRMTAGRPTPERVMQMRPAPSIIYRCYDRWKGGMVKRFPETST
jgi:hypothetical protein